MTRNPDAIPQVVPYLYYEDADAAIDFLAEGFGFEIRSARRGPDGKVLNAQVKLGDGVVFIGPGMEHFGTGPARDPELVSSRVYVTVDDIESHFSRAKAAGAHMRDEIQLRFDTKMYSASDPGGQRGTFARYVEGA